MREALAGWLGPAEWQAVALSLQVSFWATLASLPLGIFVGLTELATAAGPLFLPRIPIPSTRLCACACPPTT